MADEKVAPESVDEPRMTLLTQQQAAAEMGWSTQKIQRLRLTGKLPYFPGRPPLIDMADLAQLKVGGAEAVVVLVAAKAEAAVKKPLDGVRHEPTGIEKAQQLARTKWLRMRYGKSR